MCNTQNESEYFEYVFKNSADGMLITDASGYIANVNTSFERMLGFSNEELKGKHTSSLQSLQLGNQYNTMELIEQLKSGGKNTVTSKATWMSKGGEAVCVELSSTLHKDENNNILGTISNVRDVSQKEDVEEELRQRNRELMILNSVTSFLTQFLNIGELVDSALEKVLEIMKIESGALLLFNRETNSYSVETSRGYSPGVIARILSIDAEKDDLGKTVHRGNYYLYERDEGSRLPSMDWLDAEQINSVLSIPVKTRKQVYGMMMLGRRHGRFFSDQDIELLTNICYQVALSIENALLYKDVKNSEEKYRQLTESINIGVISFDSEGQVFQINQIAEDIFGVPREEIINGTVIKVLPDKHQRLFEQLRKDYLKINSRETLEQKVIEQGRGRNGSSLPIEISYSIWGDKLKPNITATVRTIR